MKNSINNVTISLSSIVGHSENQVAAEINGEVVMMSLEQGCYFGLDEVGTRIWSLLEQPKAVTDILEVLLEEYEIDSKTCEVGLCGFLGQLLDKGLIIKQNL